ncbi:cysteine desulfurase [Allopseudospirillum japonicum]|uniref:cysteine desulfurase n=1 Tax=Allopseudospirillum japonicum TaxID=64971 RepID=A0A1H6RVB8_9GAMM|nr:aminotransferase class V-fold PLP-dependent enzyme [Allopseudospirillum japonicum]SEI57414.1 cysteine desulfurase [Allopseudospirillum japonicum]
MIYLDYAATTPISAEIAQKMLQFMTLEGCFANPASRSHMLGWQAEQAVEHARAQVADLIKADARELVWTSGATEANNLAILGLAAQFPQKRHLITSQIEHKAVLDPCKVLQQQGYQVTYLAPDAQGRIQTQQVLEALREDTLLVSLMYVNNELGSLNPIADISAHLASHPAHFHVDAAQAVGKFPLDLQALQGIDLLSISAHKMYGPKGVGALFVRRGLRLQAQMHGGGHERGMRSGTLATHQLVGMGEAAQLAHTCYQEDHAHAYRLRQTLLEILSDLHDWQVNGADENHQAPHIVSLTFAGIDAEALLMAVPELALSTGSACNSATLDPSYVLTAIGLTRQQALASIRLSMGRYTKVQEIQIAGEQLKAAVKRLRGS